MSFCLYASRSGANKKSPVSVDWHYMTLVITARKQVEAPGGSQPSYIQQFSGHRPPMAVAEAQINILKAIVAAQFLSSCYFKVEKLHSGALRPPSLVSLGNISQCALF
ncbi:hypothetical protein EYF80_029766 [Liparis tanakae]|uniref:Uncharacterized protein n=1 Tax=Liparis tanakae TaxID=230148 RepID=A0A4Z2H2A7_9TELE|nr:hypothetical protein EYF80_029766 [Liparis tanakae]